MHKNNKISVVIATLGEPSLHSTIELLNRSSCKPSEILICLPETEIDKIVNINYQNVTIITTKIKSQVAQRVEGLRKSSGNMVLQLDSDIEIDSKALEYMIKFLTEVGPGNVVGPVYLDHQTGMCVHSLGKGMKAVVRSLYATIVCGAPWGKSRMGTVTHEGINYGVDCNCWEEERVFKAEWLPGGCILSYKQDLFLCDFYPYAGKAYCEDIIHSYLRRKKNINHWVLTKSICKISQNTSQYPDVATKESIKIRRYYASLVGGSMLRLKVYEILTLSRITLKLVANEFIFRSK